MVRFELKPKDESVNLRMPMALFEAVRSEAERAGIPYQRYIRLMLEQAVHPEGLIPRRHHRASHCKPFRFLGCSNFRFDLGDAKD